MDEKDLLNKINEESENHVPDVYGKIISAARAEGLLNNDNNTEVYSDGETVALGGVNRKAIAVTTLAALAAVSLAIALPIALSGNPNGGLNTPPLGSVSDKPFSEDYAVGAVATAKLAESFFDEEQGGEAYYSPRTGKALSLVVNPNEVGIERYISEFENYFYACNSFFGEKPAEVQIVENHDVKYNNSIIISGKFSNGDIAHYAMYYSEARILDDATVTGDEVKYYLEGYLFLNNKNYSMVGERVYADATKEKEKSLSFKAYPLFYKDDSSFVEMSVEYGADGSVTKYSFTVVEEDKTISESVLTFPAATDGDNAAYSIEFSGDDGEKGGKFTVNRPQEGWESLVVGYEIGNLTSEFRVSATKSKFERVLAPDGLVYEDLGDGTYAITGFDRRKGLPAELIIPAEFEGKKIVKIGSSAFRECLNIKKAVVPQGVTLIDSFAFYKCENLTDIIFPETLTQIDACAFYKTAITEINLPESVVTLGTQVFGLCTELEKIALPESVEMLGRELFHGCTSLKTLNVPASVKSIGEGVISRTAMEDITVDSANQYYYAESGCLMEKATKTVLGGSVGFIIPNDAKIIGEYSFYYSENLTELTLPASVTKIGDLAFDNCSITRIVLTGVEEICYGAFYNSKLQTVEFSENLSTIGTSAFSGCTELTALNFPASLTSVSDGAFQGCSSLESITVAEGNSVYHGAGNCLINGKREVVLGIYNSEIPDDGSVIAIGSDAFSGQTRLTEIRLPESILFINNHAFFGCTNLTAIGIPSGLLVIGGEAFRQCFKLVSITLPESIEVIGSYAFEDCIALQEVNLPEASENLVINNNAFAGCHSLTEISIPKGVKEISKEVYKDCWQLEKVSIPASVTFIGEQAFYGCFKLSEIQFDGTMEEWNDIGKAVGWDWDTHFVVVCKDGTIDKEGNIIN